MEDLRVRVNEFALRLAGPGDSDAWHSLVELGPTALPFVVEAFDRAVSVEQKSSLIRVASEYRSEAAVPFMTRCLGSAIPELWQTALDALVTLGGQEALEALAAMRDLSSKEKQQWIDEAIQHVVETNGPG